MKRDMLNNTPTGSWVKRLPIWLSIVLIVLISIPGCKNKSGLIESGETPTIMSTNPTDNAENVDIATTITARFNDDMDPSTITENTFFLKQDTVVISGSISYADSTAIFSPSEPLLAATNYAVTITSDVENLSGTALESNHEWRFTTAEESNESDTTPPQLLSKSPSANATGVPVETNVVATFSEPLSPATVNTGTFSLSGGSSSVSGTVSYSNNSNSAMFSPSSSLAFGTTYTATVTTGIQDTAGNALPNEVSWEFTTANEPDRTAPTVSSTNPADDQENVVVNTSIMATFSEQMDPASINTSTFTLQLQQGNTKIDGTVTYSGTTATFTPSEDLDFGRTYVATITTAAKDLAGNNLQDTFFWNFTTGQEPDNTAPRVVSTDPADNDEDISVNTDITATFSESMNASTINNSTFTVTQNGNPVAGNVSYFGTTAIFNPSGDLAFGTTYTVTITTGAKDLAGNSLASDYSWTFTTLQETTPPTVSTTNPANNAQQVPSNSNITATFSEPMNASTLNSSTFIIKLGNSQVSGSVSYSGNTASINPASNLAFGSTYTATITTGAQDLAGNSLASDYSWTFTTSQAPDNTAPEITSTNPANNATDVAAGTNITATFSEPMNAITINNNFSVTQNGSPVAGTITYSGNTATFNPSTNLNYGSTITATITTGVQDLAGNALENNFSWSFTTEQETTPPQVSSTSPDNNATGVTINTNITATFSEPLSSSTINTSTFTVTRNGNPVSGSVSYFGNTAIFNPNSNLAFNTTYTATVTTGVKDLAGNALENDYSWTFTTEAETTAPRVNSTSPDDNAIDVSLNTNITANFSELMNPLTINSSTFRVTQNGNPVSGNVTYVGTTAIFNPSSNLAFGTTYTATITTGAKDLAGNSLASNYTWTFTTLQETTPPTVSSTSPANGATDVGITQNITATFSEPMNSNTLNNSTFTVALGSSQITGAITYSGNTATFSPSSNLAYSSTYTATITTGAEDLAGNNLSKNYKWTFTTGEEPDNTAPTVSSTNPTDNATNVAINANIRATFSEPMNSNTLNNTTFTVTQNGNPVTGNINYSGNTATFTPSSNLLMGTIYTATITTGAEDLAGNNLQSNYTWSFTTEQETTPPKVSSTTPANKAIDVPVNDNITATFDEDMNSSTINTTTFTVTQNGNPVAGTVSYLGTTAVFNPNSNLAYNTEFTATITTGVEDLAGNKLAKNHKWTFTTVQETTPPEVNSTTPADNATGVSITTTISGTFSEPMNSNTLNNTTFTVTQNGNPVTGNINYSGNTATFTPSSNLLMGTIYTATITTGAEDLAGNNLQSNYTWSFTTEQETTPPTVTTMNPPNGATGVSVDTNISATFSEPMDQSTITNSTFTVSQEGSPVSGSISYSGTTATFDPDTALGFGFSYTVTVTTGVKDLAGNALVSNVVWTFSTEDAVATPAALKSSGSLRKN